MTNEEAIKILELLVSSGRCNVPDELLYYVFRPNGDLYSDNEEIEFPREDAEAIAHAIGGTIQRIDECGFRR